MAIFVLVHYTTACVGTDLTFRPGSYLRSQPRARGGVLEVRVHLVCKGDGNPPFLAIGNCLARRIPVDTEEKSFLKNKQQKL